jgi:hypothetical protein
MAETVQVEEKGEMLSFEEIWRRYPDEWVVLVETGWNGWTSTRGVVYAHAKTRKEISPVAKELNRCAVYWTGDVGEAMQLMHQRGLRGKV